MLVANVFMDVIIGECPMRIKVNIRDVKVSEKATKILAKATFNAVAKATVDGK